ncbi:MAG: hypothetical protein ACP6IP_02680 [Candidatus Njordarchaeia archaeon]
MEIQERIERLERIIYAILKSEDGPLQKLLDRINRQFKDPEKIFIILQKLEEGKTTKEIGQELGQTDRSIRDRLFKLNELATNVIGLPITEGKKGRGHILTDIGKLLLDLYKTKRMEKETLYPLTEFVEGLEGGQNSEPSS